MYTGRPRCLDHSVAALWRLSLPGKQDRERCVRMWRKMARQRAIRARSRAEASQLTATGAAHYERFASDRAGVQRASVQALSYCERLTA